MATIIAMPKLSDTMTEGTLLKWHVQAGDKIKTGKVIAEIQTDKANMEMEAFDDGILHELYVKEGDKVTLGAKMALLLEPGEKAPTEGPAVASGTASNSDMVPPEAAVTDKKSADQPPVQASSPAPALEPVEAAVPAKSGRVKASPLARKVASSLGLNLSRIKGTGPGGRIVRVDVEAAKDTQKNPPVTSSAGPIVSAPLSTKAAAPVIKPIVGTDDQILPISPMRRIIAERLLASKTQLPHFYLRMEVDAAPLMQLRSQINAAGEKTGIKYSVNDFVLKAVIAATQAVPAVNSSWSEDGIVQFKHIGLCVAISVEDGLVTPVIKKAETKSLLEISQAVKDMATRAKDKKLKPAEFDGGTITVSNLGAWGIDHFDAIINPPQAAIVSVGSIRKVPVVNDKDQIVVGQRMWLGLSGDHRVVDGAVAASFLGELRKFVETPAMMLI